MLLTLGIIKYSFFQSYIIQYNTKSFLENVLTNGENYQNPTSNRLRIYIHTNTINNNNNNNNKYEELAFQLKSIWKLERVVIVPIIISAEWVISKKTTKNIGKLAVNKNILRVGQKAVLLQTCHIVRKFLNWRLSGGPCGPGWIPFPHRPILIPNKI